MDLFGADAYGSDVLADFGRRAPRVQPTVVEAERGLVVEETTTGFVGAVVGYEGRLLRLEDRHGSIRLFPIGPGFLIDGTSVALRLPAPRQAQGPRTGRTASGSMAAPLERARTARASRIFVEGRHDAELVEKVWGADLRIEGVVVEYLEGVDNLAQVVRDFEPSTDRRMGILVDHLVPGSKESRIAQAVTSGREGEFVLVVGHPFIDVWQAVKPSRVGLTRWPEIPRNVEWKHGICEALGWPHESQADVARAWQQILGRVDSYADLEPTLLGRVEQLIDFVSASPEYFGG
ncbi:MAG TPA: DUF3097 domain-containing protein [Galbitalea sp.]|nr:DUF3097 domain-containing protein [Galbitalea sp.]